MSTTFVSLQRLSLFKSLQDALNARTYLGINDTAVAAQKLATAVNIDGVAFDGSQAIELPTKIVQIYSQTDTNTGNVSYFEDSGFSIPISTFDISKLYVDMTTNEIKFFNGTALVSSQIHGIDSHTIDGVPFDGTQDIVLPTKIVQVYSQTDPGTGNVSYFEDSGFSIPISTFDTSKLYVDMTTGQIKYFNGTSLIAAVARDTTPYIPLAQQGANNGVAELDGTGKVPAAQLPSYVDDVIEGYVTETAGVVTFYEDSGRTTVITGETGKIYVDVAATVDGTYRWSGSAFIKIGSSVSTADRAVHDGNGDVISSTYMKTADYVDATEAEIRALFNDGSGSGTGGETGGGTGGE